jgi:hypothetical protein
MRALHFNKGKSSHDITPFVIGVCSHAYVITKRKKQNQTLQPSQPTYNKLNQAANNQPKKTTKSVNAKKKNELVWEIKKVDEEK